MEPHNAMNLDRSEIFSIVKRNISENDTVSFGNMYVYYPDFSQIPFVRGTFLFLFITQSIFGIFGNVIVCLTVYKNKSLHSPVNYYIVNLAVCDFLVASFVLPMKLIELMVSAEAIILNNFGCTILRFLESVVVFTSVFTLMAISVERYNAVVHPLRARAMLTYRRVKCVIYLVWLMSILCATPFLYPAESHHHELSSEYGLISRNICHDEFPTNFRRGFFFFLFIFIYLVPLICIALSCVSITRTLAKSIPVGADPHTTKMEKGRRKVSKMVLVVIFAFAFCWSPYFVVTAVTQFHNFFEKGQFIFTMLIINLFVFTHSCVNPVVCFSMSSQFRKGFVWNLHSSTRLSLTPDQSSTPGRIPLQNRLDSRT